MKEPIALLLTAMAGMVPILLSLLAAPTNSSPPSSHIPAADGFDFPVGSPNAQGYYDAQPYGRNRHLGSDWNGNGGGNSDLGDPVFAIAHGKVTRVHDYGRGWGLVVTILHSVDPSVSEDGRIESLYAHLDETLVTPGQILTRNQPIGTIGTAHGAWPAHLHFEIRQTVGLPIGTGYGVSQSHTDPTAFIQQHRPASKKDS